MRFSRTGSSAPTVRSGSLSGFTPGACFLLRYQILLQLLQDVELLCRTHVLVKGRLVHPLDDGMALGTNQSDLRDPQLLVVGSVQIDIQGARMSGSTR